MASVAVAAGQKGTHGTLVAATVDTVTFTGIDFNEVEVLNRNGAAEIYFTVDGTAPTVGGTNCYVLPAAITSAIVGVPTTGATVVKLISAGTPTYSVSGTG